MCQTRCPQNFTPRVDCGFDPRMENARANAVAYARIQSGQCTDLFDQSEVIIEPAVVTAPNVFNHHRRIEHIVPVITEDIHRHHAHHQFVARPEPRMRQTFDSDVSVGRPLPAQTFTQMPVASQQLVPMEIDVIERFGVAPQPMNFNGVNGLNGFNGFVGQTQGMPVDFGGQAFTQMPTQGFTQGFIG
ncbi:MAG: hypothetical protein FWG67_00660 [Defluviitaleaceae bacterium]|nr:hypothetical protein [Defluviitaleaceae bacterium]